MEANVRLAGAKTPLTRSLSSPRFVLRQQQHILGALPRAFDECHCAPKATSMLVQKL